MLEMATSKGESKEKTSSYVQKNFANQENVNEIKKQET